MQWCTPSEEGNIVRVFQLFFRIRHKIMDFFFDRFARFRDVDLEFLQNQKFFLIRFSYSPVTRKHDFTQVNHEKKANSIHQGGGGDLFLDYQYVVNPYLKSLFKKTGVTDRINF